MDRIKRERFCTVLSFFDVMHTKKILVDVLVLPGIRRMMQYIDYNSDRRKSMEIPKAEGEKTSAAPERLLRRISVRIFL